MAQKSLFFNAFPDQSSPTGYDRNYNADDISDWFSIVCDTGVVKAGLQVLATTGMTINVAAGKATIKGKGYINNSLATFTVPTAPTGSSPRYDYVILRMDNTQTASARTIQLKYVTGTSSVPTVANLTRNANIYDLMLAYIVVNPNTTTIQQSYIKDKRGDQTYCPWFTAVKGYDDYYDAIVQQFESNVTMASAGTQVVTNLASNLYNQKYSLIEVYSNGLKEEDTDYTVSATSSYITITFANQKAAGSQINVVLNNFIDGEGLSTAIDDYNNWVQAVAEIQTANEDIYLCNGVNDNVQLSTIGLNWLRGGDDNSSKKIKIVGNFGWSAMAYGDGTSANPFRFFNLAGSFTRRLILDFSDCSAITITPTDGKYTVVFATQNLNVIGANIQVSNTAANTQIKVFSTSSGYIRCESCRFWINAYNNSTIASCGTFVNCRGSVANADGNSYCFQTTDAALLRVEGGEYYAYTGNNSSASAIVGQSSTNAVSILYGVNAPTQARSGYYQKNSIWQVGNAGWVNCTDLVSTLPLNVVSGKSNIRGTIALNKPDQM